MTDRTNSESSKAKEPSGGSEAKEPSGSGEAKEPSGSGEAKEPSGGEAKEPSAAAAARSAGAEQSSPPRPWSAMGILRRLGRNGVVIVVVAIAFAIGYLANRGSSSKGGDGHAGHASAGGKPAKKQIWTCSMHPQIQQPKPGKCPICGMTLIPAEGGGASQSSNPRELVMSERARKLAEI